MSRVDDVAAAILERTGPVSTFKLQKLVYYCQAWHLVWDEAPLFNSRIEAWANGPVCRDLYDRHRGWFTVPEWRDGDSGALKRSQRETVEAVVEAYGRMSGQQLSQLTHDERPWREARAGLHPGERGCAEITLEAMADYYGSLAADDEAADVEEINTSADFDFDEPF